MYALGSSSPVEVSQFHVKTYQYLFFLGVQMAPALPLGRKLDCVTWGQKVAKEGLILHFRTVQCKKITH